MICATPIIRGDIRIAYEGSKNLSYHLHLCTPPHVLKAIIQTPGMDEEIVKQAWLELAGGA
jgi:hypothetical protein